MEKKQGIWTRIRHQYGNASAALSQLNISSHEHDGDGESDTVIHNALARFYMNRDGGTPEWLGAAPGSQNFRAPYSRSANSSTASVPAMRTGTKGSSALQDIYARRQQHQQQQQQQQPAQSHPAALQTYRRASPEQPPMGLPRSNSFQPDMAQKDNRFKSRLKASRANW